MFISLMYIQVTALTTKWSLTQITGSKYILIFIHQITNSFTSSYLAIIKILPLWLNLIYHFNFVLLLSLNELNLKMHNLRYDLNVTMIWSLRIYIYLVWFQLY